MTNQEHQPTWPEYIEGALLIQPGQGGPTEIVQTAGGNTTVERLKEGFRDEGENVEFPRGQGSLPHIHHKHFFELAIPGVSHGSSCGRQLGLGIAVW